MINYMMRVYFYDFLKTNGSVEKFLVKLLQGSETDRLEDVIKPLVPQLPIMVSIDQTFEILGFKVTLSTDQESAPKSADEDTKIKIYVTVSTGTEEPGQGELDIDLDFLPQYAQDLVEKVDDELRKDDWMTNNYGSENKLLENIADALSDAVKPLFIDPDALDGKDTVQHIYNDAMMAWAHGDEGAADAETRARRKAENELLTGDTFINSAQKTAWMEC